MVEAHQTTTPEQARTDEWAVFGDQSAQLDAHNDLVLIGRVEVPRYSQPTVDGVRLDTSKRLALAVHRAIAQSHHEPLGGEEFMVMRDLDTPMDFVRYEQNPAFDAVWNPESGEQSAASTADKQSKSEEDDG
jgi:hypothetical protein